MTRMKRLGALFCAATALAVVGATQADAQQNASGNVTLTAIVPYTQLDADYFELQDMYKQFHAQNPNITIKFDAMAHDMMLESGYERVVDAIVSQLASWRRSATPQTTGP